MPGIPKTRCGSPHTFFYALLRRSSLGLSGAALLTACLAGGGLPPPLAREPAGSADEAAAQALYERGVAEAGDRRYETAFTAFDSVVRAYPGSRFSGISLRERGLAEYRLGREELAASDLQRFLDLAPDYETTDTAIVLASSLQRTHNAEGAFTTLTRYLAEDAGDVPGARVVAEAAARDLDGAVAARLAEELPRRAFLEPLYLRAADEIRPTDPERAARLEGLAGRAARDEARERVVVEEPGRGGSAAAVGAILPETGRFAAVGQEIADGVRLALSEVARDGNGPALSLDLVPEEEAGTGAAVSRLAREGVRVVIGPLGSEAALASAAAARDERMLIVTPTATDSSLLDQGPGVVALNATRGDLGEALGRFAARELGLARVAVIGSNDDYGRANARGFRRAFEELGGVVVLERYAATGEANFGAPLRMARHQGAEALFLPSRSADQVLTVLSQIEYYSGGTFRLLGTEVWRDPSFLERAGKFAEGAYFADTFSPDSRATRYWDFRAAYSDRYGRPLPSNFPAWGYDAAMLALRYLTGGEEGTAEATYVGAAATYRIRGGRVSRVPLVSHVESGRPVLVAVADRPIGSRETAPDSSAGER